ncbi:MAG: twin-arginine translocase TatA/TatE family subunit [Anaerolineales bacterium]|nr:twin-arginine translocase TatA/TatE family subunit [Anaerolineales bacterium]
MEIFGIGTAEFLLVALLILIIAGPRRSAVWAREAGRYVRQFRIAWQKMMDEMTKDLGEDGQQIRKAAQDFQRVTSDIRRATSAPNLVGEAVKIAEKVEQNRKPTTSATTERDEEASGADRYSAWQYTPDAAETPPADSDTDSVS